MALNLKKSIKSFIRNSIFVRKTLFLVRDVYTLPSFIREKLSFVGQFDTKLPNGKLLKLNHFGFFIENEIFWKGIDTEWERESIKIWLKLSQISDTIFDIGSNTGIYSLLAKCYNDSSKVYAFEPQPNIYECFSKQIALNNFDIKLLRIALSNEDGKTKFFNYNFDINSNTTAGSLNESFRNNLSLKAIEVETMRLDNFLKKEKIDKIDLIKMDVESFEPQVIEGAGDKIRQFQPIILIEIQDDEIGFKVQNLLSPMNFDIYNIDENVGLIKVEKLSAKIFKNFLIVPHSKKELLESALNII